MSRTPGPADLIVHAMALSETTKIIRACAVYLDAENGTGPEEVAAGELEVLVKQATTSRLSAQQTIFILSSLVVSLGEFDKVQAWFDEQAAHLAHDIGKGYEEGSTDG